MGTIVNQNLNSLSHTPIIYTVLKIVNYVAIYASLLVYIRHSVINSTNIQIWRAIIYKQFIICLMNWFSLLRSTGYNRGYNNKQSLRVRYEICHVGRPISYVWPPGQWGSLFDQVFGFFLVKEYRLSTFLRRSHSF